MHKMDYNEVKQTFVHFTTFYINEIHKGTYYYIYSTNKNR